MKASVSLGSAECVEFHVSAFVGLCRNSTYGRLEEVENGALTTDAPRGTVRVESPGGDCLALAPGSAAHSRGDLEHDVSEPRRFHGKNNNTACCVGLLSESMN